MLKYLFFLVIFLATFQSYSEKKKDYVLTDKAIFPKNKTTQSVRSTVKCQYCNGKGFIKVTIIKNNEVYSHLKICPVCRGKGYKSINIK